MKTFALNKLGFTLIELVLVMALIAIVAVSAAPMFADTQIISLDGASRKVESDMRYAQNLAMTTGDDYGFRTTGGDGGTTYEVYNVATGDPVESPYDHNPMLEDFAQENEEYHGVRFESTDTIIFDDMGNATATAGDLSVVIQTENGHSKTVLVNGAGLISVQHE